MHIQVLKIESKEKIVVTKFRRVVTSESEGGVVNWEVRTAGF